tara:strand:+ start:723 stop:2153 length:1431 start_codon:yes stop_codon:yes gene_type:complete
MGYFKYLIPIILAMVFWYVFFAIITISTANAQTPDWVLGKGHKSFPETKYIVGVGVSEKSPIMATQSARAELIKTIGVEVHSVSSDYNSREKSFSKSSIVTEAGFPLEGSQVKDGWYDHRNNLYYSFVVIERDHVLETLRTKIDTLFLNIESMLKQGNDCLNNYDIITALVHYYDGYKETDKVLPYIQTYNSVIMKEQKYKGWYDYKLLFKEKIQGIVNNISLDKISGTVDQTNIYLNARVLYKGKGIKDFPIKFSSGYNHYNERVICNRVGECGIEPRLIKVARPDTVDILVKAVVDLQTLEKHFNYSLQKSLFGRLELIGVSFQVRKKIIAPVVKQVAVKYEGNKYPLTEVNDKQILNELTSVEVEKIIAPVVRQPVVRQPVVKQAEVKHPLTQVATTGGYTTPSSQEALANYEKYCVEDEPCPEYDSSRSYDPYFGDIKTYQKGGKRRSRGSFWLNFNFGSGRSIGYVNRGGW